nr:serine/arginine repetitive matrix protein 2-like isoform X1 [Procambarus clarkii]
MARYQRAVSLHTNGVCTLPPVNSPPSYSPPPCTSRTALSHPVRQRTKGHLLSRSTSLQLRYERERLELQKRVTEQLVSDVFGLYKKSLFVDLKLEASRGNVYCHQLFFAARVPALWRLLLEIAKFQQPNKKSAENLVCIQLPDVDYKELQKFTRSLYSDRNNSAAGIALRRKLEDTLAVLQQRALVYSNKIRIERLSSDEEHHVQQLILKQLQKGQLSKKKGNIQDVEEFISNGVHCPYQTCTISDCDSNSTATLKPQMIKQSSNISKSVRPKSSQKVCAQKPKSLGYTMNITNHTVVNVNKCEIREKQPDSTSDKADDHCDTNIEDGVESSATLTRKGKISLKTSLPTKRSSYEDQSPSGQLSNQESPVFNVSMIKELQTSPMQVSGESFQDKLRDKRERSPSRSQRASTNDFTPIESLHDRDEKKGPPICSNGHTGQFYPEKVKIKEGKPHKYGAMSSTKENASLHQANILARQQQLQQQPKNHVQSVSTSKTYLHRKSQSVVPDSRDNVELDNNSVSNSGSDHRLSNLHETSSLEVELPSSHEENSSSHDSDESPEASSRRLAFKPPGKECNHVVGEKENNLSEPGRATTIPVNPMRPLVRARTYEILEGIASGPDKSTEEPTEKKESEPEESVVKTERGALDDAHNNIHSFGTPKRSVRSHGFGKDNPGNGKERKVSDESISSYYENTDDPEKLREMERKKGSLIFEHNFQTYSNIPTTNMMTASMMTASMSSESGSMGMGSLYSSMMDSAMMGSIHSLGALEAPVVDPIPRPASVGLPVVHSMEDVKQEMSRAVSRRPPLRVQKSTDEMALELQLDLARRGTATRSPSPDSLSVDIVTRRESETVDKENSPRKVNRNKSLETSTSSLKKEEMDNEEKEQDDRENESKSSETGHNGGKSDKKEMSAEESSFKSLPQLTGSPRLSRELSENTPIISGGSTLKREKDTGERTSIPKSERQVSIGSVKDVDSIPLVFGYIGPQDEEQHESKVEDKEASVEGEDEKHQSIFPMFIDLNDIPSPSIEEAKETEKKEAAKVKSQSSAVYMYIEADTPSPKSRRKRRSESDGIGIPKSIESRSEAEFTSLPPVLAGPAPSIEGKKTPDSIKVEANGSSDEGGNKEKKGFFMFIEAESSPKLGSPKPRRRPAPPPKKKSENAMTRSAPSDSILFSTPESSSKLMTKSVIDREEFIAQPPTRKNVSLNDKINESSTSRDGSFVSGIPRPIHVLKNKGASSKSSNRAKPSPLKRETSSQRDHSVSRTKDEHTSETNDMATSRDISVSELGPSQSVSFSDIVSASLPQETEPSEVSDVSSLLSSIERSNGPSDQGDKEPCSRLGEDLLRMFLNEINTDVAIQIGEKRIRAHKCILASRCVYFAAMLSGHWVESAGNVIKLQGFSADCVMVALKHIYSGTSTVPEGVRVGELAALADMLALDGLKDVISLHLKAKMCHYFHKPCSGCLEGVLDVLPIAGAYCLDDLYHRCLRWVAKHFVVVLPTRNFAALPPEVQDRCLKQLLDDMSVSNVIDTALGCERVLSSLPMVRWAQPVFDSAAQLLEAATSFIAANMSGVLTSDRFIGLGRDSGWSIESLQDTMRVACELIRPDQAVLSHLQLAKFLEQSQEDGLLEVSENYLNFLETILNQIEKFMIHNANRVAVCRKWPLLSTSTQRRIKDAALVVVEFSRPTAPRPKFSSANRRLRGTSSESSGVPGRSGDHRLMRSASATAVPSSQRVGVRRPPASGQDPTRCQTPPAILSRPRTQTPPPTRASTLRAQARQAAIQRSQSARTVAERPRRPRQGNDTSTDEDTHSSNKRATPVGGFTRGATFTRSLSRPEPGRPNPQTPTKAPAPASRPCTPGPPEPSQLPRRTTTVNRTPSHTTTGSSASEDELPLKKSTTTPQGRTLTSLNEGSGNEAKLARTQSTEARSRTPTRRPELRSSITNLSKAGRSQQESQPSPQCHSDSGSHTPRTPKVDKTEPRRQSDVKNGNITRTRAVMGRKSTRSPMREPGRVTGLATGRGTSPTPSTTFGSGITGCRSRSSSVTSRPIGSTAIPSPAVGSRSNTFSKDDSKCPSRKPVLP